MTSYPGHRDPRTLLMLCTECTDFTMAIRSYDLHSGAEWTPQTCGEAILQTQISSLDSQHDDGKAWVDVGVTGLLCNL